MSFFSWKIVVFQEEDNYSPFWVVLKLSDHFLSCNELNIIFSHFLVKIVWTHLLKLKFTEKLKLTKKVIYCKIIEPFVFFFFGKKKNFFSSKNFLGCKNFWGGNICKKPLFFKTIFGTAGNNFSKSWNKIIFIFTKTKTKKNNSYRLTVESTVDGFLSFLTKVILLSKATYFWS